MFWIVAATIMVSLVTGAHGNCYREGTKLRCTGTFKGKQFAVKTDVKVCHNPVETDIEFEILGRIFRKHYTGNQDFLLQGISIDQSKRVYRLNVNVKPLSNGDRKITRKVNLHFHKDLRQRTLHKKCPYLEFFQYVFSSIWTEFTDLWSKSSYSVRVRKKRTRKTPNTDTSCAVETVTSSESSSLWWNSQTLAIKITIGAVASLLLIILILSIIYCCLRHQNSERQGAVEDKLPEAEEKGAVAEKQPADVDTKKSKLPEPIQNQFHYTLHVNDVA